MPSSPEACDVSATTPELPDALPHFILPKTPLTVSTSVLGRGPIVGSFSANDSILIKLLIQQTFIVFLPEAFHGL